MVFLDWAVCRYGDGNGYDILETFLTTLFYNKIKRKNLIIEEKSN